jgi:hypothetical protein
MSDVSRVRFKDKTLVDPIFQNPVDEYQGRARRRNVVIFIVVALAILVVVAARSWFN